MKYATQQRILSIRFDLTVAVTALILLAALTTSPVHAQSITVLHSFSGGGAGSAPTAGVTLDRAGNLYGTTNGDITGSPSTVYKMTHAGSGWLFNTLYTFNHPNDPTDVAAPVVFGPDGALYGTAPEGAQFNLGAVFVLRPPSTVCKSVSCPWELTILHSFGGLDGTHPDLGSLVFDSAGNIYGTTFAGGAHSHGTVFELTRSKGWAESVLYSFTGDSDGGSPENGVAFDSAGNLYGTTPVGGSAGVGTVYQLSPSAGGWTETTLYTFTGGDDGANPIGGVAVDAQGNLYGTAARGGTDGVGTAWELSPSSGGWAFTLLHSFAGRTNPGPLATPTLDAAGNIYGTSETNGNNFGFAFKLTPSGGGWNFTSYDFDGSNGNEPGSSVALDASGNLYGTAPVGGTGCDCGVVWQITP